MITIAPRQAFGMYLMISIKKKRQSNIIPPDIIVFNGVFDPILLISDDRLREAEGEYVEKNDPTSEPLPRAMSS